MRRRFFNMGVSGMKYSNLIVTSVSGESDKFQLFIEKPDGQRVDIVMVQTQIAALAEFVGVKKPYEPVKRWVDERCD